MFWIKIIGLVLTALLFVKAFVYFIIYDKQPTNIEVLIILFNLIISTTKNQKGGSND